MASEKPDLMESALATALGNAILAELDGPRRDAIIEKAVRSEMTGYEIKAAVAKLVQDRAKQIAAVLIEGGKFDRLLANEVEKAMADVIGRVRAGAAKALVRALFGSERDDRGHSTAGLILDIWREEKK